MDLELHDRRALVTGGTRGIGLAIGRALAKEGAAVVLVGREQETLDKEAERAAIDSGSRVEAFAVDTTDATSVAAMFVHLRVNFGLPDILINAAATPSAYPGLAESDLEHEIDVKVRGYLRLVRAASPYMIEKGWGRIVNVGGIATRQSGSLVGSVRNAAVVAMTKNLADELGPAGINVTTLHPGWTRTERTPKILAALAEALDVSPGKIESDRVANVSIGRLVTAEEVADVAVFLASPRSVAINGDSIYAGGGVRGHIHY